MTTVTDRIGKRLVKIDGRPCVKGAARKETICKHSKRTIEAGDVIYRPIDNRIGRHDRWLASEIEKLEREQKK